MVFSTSVGTPINAGDARQSFRSALQLVPDINPMEWTPRELQHSFVSVMADAGVPLEEISRLVGRVPHVFAGRDRLRSDLGRNGGNVRFTTISTPAWERTSSP